ncbi:variant erythrocyte surface antigen-1 family protein [Babesia caballi]|uniref:Variant erythrocyte surface antigen-1 family protein n=1 Tax=Babesia caballi TaxID=5871 RepID=A0AAV4LT86_BABCB|nr:variant erythrocyte surface antigen-1 family protein [Babesia caballi]
MSLFYALDSEDNSKGGHNRGNERTLAQAIVALPDFKEAIDAATKKLTERGDVNVSQTIGNLKGSGTLGELIKKLAEGLSTFIGYGGKGQGIANVIDPLQQLRYGLVKFLYGFLDKLRTLSVDDKGAIEALGKARMGKPDVSFELAMEQVSQISQSGSNTNNIPDVVQALKNVDQLKQNKDELNTLANGFKNYLNGVLTAVKGKAGNARTQVEDLCSQLDTLLTSVWQKGDINKQIKNVRDANEKLNFRSLGYPAQPLVEGVKMGTENFLVQLKTDGYKSAYQPTSTWATHFNSNSPKAAQIFLGCLPLYYYWLTYLYWKCRENGDWAGQNFTRPDLKHFMVGMGYNGSYLNAQNRGVNGSRIAALIAALGLSSAISRQPSHPDFLSELDNSLQSVIGSSVSSNSVSFNDHSLSALFHLCRCYFTGKQIINPVTERRPPTSIREMLYWLSALQFSPHYSDLEKQIEKHIPNHGLHVADSAKVTPSGSSGPGSASTPTSTGDTLTRDQMKGFLLSSCLSAPGVLGAIQGNSANTDGEPWLYSLFSNSMKLHYPSGATLFSTVSNYAYALQFQLNFLYIQCRTNYSQSYGWQWCRYGHSAHPGGQKTNELASWICSAPNCGRFPYCAHNSTACDHIKNCGQQNKSSPLQAFLTDNLKGFHVSQKPDPESLNHLDNHPSGSMCHVKMGFTTDTLTKDPNATGWYIYYLLDHFCSGSTTPLRQLCEKFGCLTKRTPRSLGDLFGFIWHLNGQLFKNTRPTLQALAKKLVDAIGQNNQSNAIPQFLFDILKKAAHPSSLSGTSSSGLALSLETMAPAIPFLYQLFVGKEKDFLPAVLFDLKGTTHKGSPSYTGPHNNLYSLQNPECTGPNCGTYVSPLCYSNGSAFAPRHASSYFSWVLYLIDDFEVGLQVLLDEFTNIDCTKSGCHEQKCQSEHSPAQHGSSPTCQCDSVVHCGGVLPLLYSNGFSFASAYSLKGGVNQSSGKKTCQQFHAQLTAVLAQNERIPLFKLLLTIDSFLYLFRIYFFYNLSSFWIMYVCIVLYIYFLRADLFHLKSHVRFPSSHGIPPIGLLTTGKSTVLKNLTKLTYFTP